MQSAVRLPTPPPQEALDAAAKLGRKRSQSSQSPPPFRPSPYEVSLREKQTRRHPDGAPPDHANAITNGVKAKEPPPAPKTEEEKIAEAKKEYDKLLNQRSGGTYIPPAKLRQLQSQINDKTSKEYQRMAWEALKKSIQGVVNRANVSNMKYIVSEIFQENLLRGKGLLCRSLMKAAASSTPFIPIYACLAAIVNTKLPQIGELLIKRLIVQFRKAYKRNDKAVCMSSTSFIGHLINFQVCHELLAGQMLLLLLNQPTDDSVEIAVNLTREVGQYLSEKSAAIANAIFDQYRNILHEEDIHKKVQYSIEVLFEQRKQNFKDNPIMPEGLDLIEDEDLITHRIGLDDESVDVQTSIDVFRFDLGYEEHENDYKKLKAEILGEEDDSGEEEYESGESSDDEEAKEEKAMEIKDQTNTNLVTLRRQIYLTIMSSVDFEEAAHKLMKVQIAGNEPELPSMIIECCSQERTYSKFFGLLGERFAKLNRLWTGLFEEAFTTYWDTCHRYETSRLRNIAKFFGHMLSSDAISWGVLRSIRLTEDDTTSSSRIFLKILVQDLAEALGMKQLQERFKSDLMKADYEGLFPIDEPRNTRFSINYFTSIGMGALTEDMREHLKNAPKPAPPAALPPLPASRSASRSSYSSSYSSYTGSSRTYTGSRSRSRSSSDSRSPPRRGGRDRGRHRSDSRSPPRRGRGRSPSSSRSDSSSRSRSRRNRRDYGRRRGPRPPSSSRSPPRNGRPGGGGRGRGSGRGQSHSRSDSYSSSSRSRGPPLRDRGGRYRRDRRHSSSPPHHSGRGGQGGRDGRAGNGARGRGRSPSYSSRSRSPPRRSGALDRERGERGRVEGRGRDRRYN